MYQKKETRTESTTSHGEGGGSTTSVHYHYTDGWYSYPIDSSMFNENYARNANPNIRQWPFKSENFVNDSVYMGMFKLNKNLNESLGEITPVPYPEETLK